MNDNRYRVPGWCAGYICACVRVYAGSSGRFLTTRLAESSLLSSRVAWTCRHPTSFYDSLLLLSDPAHRQLGLSWRTNTFGRFSRCSTCGSPYSPSHIRGCSLLPISAEDLTSLLNSKSYTSFISHMTFLKSSLSRSS